MHIYKDKTIVTKENIKKRLPNVSGRWPLPNNNWPINDDGSWQDYIIESQKCLYVNPTAQPVYDSNTQKLIRSINITNEVATEVWTIEDIPPPTPEELDQEAAEMLQSFLEKNKKFKAFAYIIAKMAAQSQNITEEQARQWVKNQFQTIYRSLLDQ